MYKTPQGKPSGYRGSKNDLVWIKELKSGKRYMCSGCGSTWGAGVSSKENHEKGCPAAIIKAELKVEQIKEVVDRLDRRIKSVREEYNKQMNNLLDAKDELKVLKYNEKGGDDDRP